MENVVVIDQPRWPALDARATPATMSFRIEWRSTGEPVTYDDPMKQFRFTGTRAICQLEASVEVPSVGFSWKSDSLDTSRAEFAIIGREVNGKYYSPR
jgi:hypothetical protein